VNVESDIRSPFNYVQVIITALGAAYLNVILYFVGQSAGASMKVGVDPVATVSFAQVLGYTLAPMLVLGMLVFGVGRLQPGVCKVAQWVGLAMAILSIALSIMSATSAGTAVFLSLMHVVVGAAWFFAVRHSNKASIASSSV